MKPRKPTSLLIDYFDGSTYPIIYQTNSERTAEVAHRGNDFSTASGDRISTGGAFEASDYYSHTFDGASEVPRFVTAGAGRQ